MLALTIAGCAEQGVPFPAPEPTPSPSTASESLPGTEVPHEEDTTSLEP